MDVNTASREEMLVYAREELGINPPNQISKPELKTLIAQHTDQQIEAAQQPELAPKEAAMLRTLRQQPKVQIRIFENKDHPARVPVSVNGIDFTIKPGQWVTVPLAVVEVLNNAMQVAYTQVDDPSAPGGRRMLEHRSLAFPFEQKPVAHAQG